jgi:hypothetical protein
VPPPTIVISDEAKWLLFLLMAIVMIVAIVFILRNYLSADKDSKKRSDKKKAKEEKKAALLAAGARSVEELIQTIEMTYDSVERMSDIRLAIRICYAKMCGVIAAKGLTRSPHITPREFYTTTRRTLNVKSRSMKNLTVLFEEAVYSEHPMGQPQRDSALKLLKGTVEEIKTAA